MRKSKKHDDRISTRLTRQQRESIEQKIAKGEYETLSDFLRVAIEKTLAA